MSRILFIQTQQYAYPGLYYICGALKAAGHQYKVHAGNRFDVIAKHVKTFNPDVIGFPCLTGLHKEVLEIAALIKKAFPACKILLGGIHPTLFPQIVYNENIDFICKGEGEFPTCELLDAIDAKLDTFNIPNITWKRDGIAIENEMRALNDPLDSLPFPDYSIYSNHPVIANDSYPTVFMTRGCPFSCTYCHNSNQKQIYKGKGKYVRSFSFERIMEEVQSALFHYPKTRAVFLGADTLGTDFNWLSNLLHLYSSRFNVPYNCLIRPEFINNEIAKLLKETNCYTVAFGVESGSERIRKELLNRNYTNQQLIQAANVLKNHKINFRTYNIIGFPTEKKSEMLATLELNLKIKPNFPWCSIYTPYPETKLSEFCISEGYLEKNFNYDDVPLSFFNDTILKNVERDFILNLHAFFQTIVMLPFLYPLLKKMLETPHNRFFKIIFKVVYSYVCIKSERRSFYSFLKLAIANRNFFK